MQQNNELKIKQFNPEVREPTPSSRALTTVDESLAVADSQDTRWRRGTFEGNEKKKLKLMEVYARDFPTGAPFGERMKAWKAVRQEVNEAFPDDETPVSVATCQKCVRDTIKEMSPSFGQFAKGKLTGSSRLTTNMEKVVYDAWYQVCFDYIE